MIFKQAFKFIIHKKVFSKSSRKIIRSKKKRNEKKLSSFIHIGHNFQKPYRTYNLAWFPKTDIIQFEF